MLIPTVLALSEFFANNFPNISWYPYWYLGNPYHYLIGPVVPTLLWVVGGIGGVGVSLEAAYLFLIFTSLIAGGFGTYLLLRDWEVEKRVAVLSGILYTILPAGFILVNYQNGLNHVAFGLLPFAFLLFKKFLVKENKVIIVFLVFTITIMFLTSISILLPLVIGFIALFVSSFRKDDPYEKIGKIILLILLSLSLSTFWYTPEFWWITLTNPSLGGVALGKLAWSILQFSLQFLPLVFAIVVVKFKRYKFQGHILFGLIFFASFLSLSVVRFISDPDFVMDWISFGLEMQMGGAIILGHVFLSSRTSFGISKRLLRRILLAMTSGTIFVSIVFNIIIIKNFFDNSSNNSYQSSIISMLKKNIKENERVFLSGSSVFFVNSKLNIQQVRGGIDQGSIHPFWAHGAYQIREGENGDLTYSILKSLGTSYVLVHAQNSKEPFRDFKHPDKFDSEYFKLVSEEEGNRLYKVNNSSIGRIADSSILDVQKLKNGEDYRSIDNYNLSFIRPLSVKYQKPNEITIEGNFGKGEIAALAISYDKLWTLAYGNGKIVSDSFGNMVITPKNTGRQKFELVYEKKLMDKVLSLGLSVVLVLIILKYNRVYPYVKKRLPKLSVGLRDEEDY